MTASDRERVPTQLPLPDYFRWAWEQNNAHRDSIRRGATDGFRSAMWEFVRRMAAHPELRGLQAEDAFRLLSVIEVKRADRRLSWPELFPDSDDPAIEFHSTWEKVRVPYGDDMLVLAVGSARDRPMKLRNSISEKYSLYVSIAAHLQCLRPGDYINLPVERLATILGVETRTVSYYSQQAQNDGYLRRIAKHHALSRQAARYTFACERFNTETGEELTEEVSPHFHKDSKESEDLEDLKESHDQRETSRTEEEPERRKGLSGFKSDFERTSGKLRAGFSRKNGGVGFAERQKELKEQARFLEARKR